MVMMPPAMLEAAVPTFADVPAANGKPIMEPTAAMAADGNAVMESTAPLEATAAMEAATAAMEATAAAVKATAATMAAIASGICRDRQNHRATQHGSTCSEFRRKVQHQCRNSTRANGLRLTARDNAC